MKTKILSATAQMECIKGDGAFVVTDLSFKANKKQALHFVCKMDSGL